MILLDSCGLGMFPSCWIWNFFLLYSKLTPFKYLKHAFELILGSIQKDDVGDVTHFQALTTALSGTIGLGNIVAWQSQFSC